MLHLAAAGRNPHCLAALLAATCAGGPSTVSSFACSAAASAAVTVPASDTLWTPLHTACHAGNVTAVAALVRHITPGAVTSCCDAAGRTPLDLLVASVDVACAAGITEHSVPWSGVFSWGSAVNFGLGRQVNSSKAASPSDETPRPVVLAPSGGASEVDESHAVWTTVSAGKYHSACVDAQGRLFTWGWGAARTGHTGTGNETTPYENSGAGSSRHGGVVLLPRQLLLPVPTVRVVSVACGKHHTLCCTSDGAVFAWGTSKDGRLGLAGKCDDTVYVPTRLPAFTTSSGDATRIAAVFCGAKHSGCVSADGRRLFTWGANGAGQLGYGCCDVTGGADKAGSVGLTPRLVDALACCRGALPSRSASAASQSQTSWTIAAVALGKRHSLVLTTDGDILSWGYGHVTPRRVMLATASSLGTGPQGRPRFSAIAAGTVASLAVLSGSGIIVAWPSHDLRAHAVHMSPGSSVQTVTSGVNSPASNNAGVCTPTALPPAWTTPVFVSVAASKTRCAAVTETGDVYTWDVATCTPGPASTTPGSGNAAAPGKPPLRKTSTGGGTPAGSMPKTGSFGALSTSPASSPSLRAGNVLLSSGGGSTAQQLVHAPHRVASLAQVVQLAVGEKHTLAIVHARPPRSSPCNIPLSTAKVTPPAAETDDDAETALDDCQFSDNEDSVLDGGVASPTSTRRVSCELPSLKRLCEDAAARCFGADPGCALGLAEAADALDAVALRQHACGVALANLRCVLHMHGGAHAFSALSTGVLLELQRLIGGDGTSRYGDAHGLSSNMASRSLANAEVADLASTASLLQRLDVLEARAVQEATDAAHIATLRARARRQRCGESGAASDEDSDGDVGVDSASLEDDAESPQPAAAALRPLRALRKKLLSLAALEEKLRAGTGAPLDGGQLAKLARKGFLAEQLAALEAGGSTLTAPDNVVDDDGASSDSSSKGGARASGRSQGRCQRRNDKRHAPPGPVIEAVPSSQNGRAMNALPPAEASPASPATQRSGSGPARQSRAAPSLLCPPPVVMPQLPASPQYNASGTAPAGSSARPRRMMSLSAFLAGEDSAAAPSPATTSPPAATPPPSTPPPRGWRVDASSGRAAINAPLAAASHQSPGAAIAPGQLRAIMAQQQQQHAAALAARARSGYSLAAAAASTPIPGSDQASALSVPLAALLLSASSSPARSAVAWPAAQAAASSVLLSPSPLAAIGAPVQQRRASSSGGGTQSSWYIHEGQDAASPGGQASVGGSSLHTILANARREREIAADEALARQMQAQEEEAAAAAVGPGAHGRRRGRRQ